MTTINPQIDIEFNTLPASVQDFILSDEVVETVQTIEEGNDIPEERGDDFALLVFGLMVGTTSIDRFLQDLKYTYHCDDIKAHDILLDVNRTLLQQIYFLIDQEEGSTPEIPVESHNEHPLPAVTSFQEPVAALLEDPHPEAHHDEGPVPLSKSGIPRNTYDGKDPYREEEPTYELK